MKLIAPDYFGEFACLKGACRHSCCIGWEIDVDADALAFYRSVPGDFGRRLRGNIEEGEGEPHFRLGEGERCPFLNGDGLCDMILELGEDSLCQICADHPRFRNFIGDWVEIGLGLCCEAAGRLILGRRDKVDMVILEDDGAEDAPGSDAQALLTLRRRLMDIAQDRSMPPEMRTERLAEAIGAAPEDPDWQRWVPFLLGLERLDDAWALRLEALLHAGPAPVLPEAWHVPFEQLMVYLLFRHLPGALEDGDISGRVRYALFAWKLMHALFQLCLARGNGTLENLVEIARLYSSEIEYSDENLYAILDELQEF